jgi:hypothetical protein
VANGGGEGDVPKGAEVGERRRERVSVLVDSFHELWESNISVEEIERIESAGNKGEKLGQMMCDPDPGLEPISAMDAAHRPDTG